MRRSCAGRLVDRDRRGTAEKRPPVRGAPAQPYLTAGRERLVDLEVPVRVGQLDLLDGLEGAAGTRGELDLDRLGPMGAGARVRRRADLTPDDERRALIRA